MELMAIDPPMPILAIYKTMDRRYGSVSKKIRELVNNGIAPPRKGKGGRTSVMHTAWDGQGPYVGLDGVPPKVLQTAAECVAEFYAMLGRYRNRGARAVIIRKA